MYQGALQDIIDRVVAPAAAEVDRTGDFPRDAIRALGEAGLLSLTVPTDFGGAGKGLREATSVPTTPPRNSPISVGPAVRVTTTVVRSRSESRMAIARTPTPCASARRRARTQASGEFQATSMAFLLSVLGEGTFLDLLWFLHEHAPDAVTGQVARLALQDEARHVAFGVAHVAHTVTCQPAFLSRLRSAVERRHDALVDAAGLNERVFDALVVLAAGEWTPSAIAAGWRRVQSLLARMDDGRRRRLAAIGFPSDEAAELSALHTRNFM